MNDSSACVISELEVAPPSERGSWREQGRETQSTLAVEPAPSVATSHTSMRTQVSRKDRGKEEEEGNDDDSSSYSSSSSHNEAAEIARKPPQQEAPPKHIQRKDTFFDQPISEHDYSSAIEALSQSKSRDDDVESDKPAYSPRQRTFSESSSSSSSSSGSDTSDSDSESETAVLSRKDVGDDGSPRDKQNEKSEKISVTEVRVL